MTTYGKMEVQVHVCLTSALVGGEWSASRLGCFTPKHPLDRRLSGTQIRSGRCGEKSLTLPGIEFGSQVIATELSSTHFYPTGVFLQSPYILNIILIINGSFVLDSSRPSSGTRLAG
jgi:hypothetical protein